MILPPEALDLARAHRLRQQELARRAVSVVGDVWRTVDPNSPAVSWAGRPAATAQQLMTLAQQAAVTGADDYVAAVLATQGAAADPAGQVSTRALSGVASDGRDLGGLLGYPAFEAQALLDGGMDGVQAASVGARHLARIVATQVQDAARVGTGVAIVSDRRTRGWVRMVTPPSCARCVILAGRWYAHNHGFQRHPQCDCVHMPSAEVIQPQSPKALFDAMSDQDLRRAGWSQADVQAIHDGADLYQVTNARRALRSVQVAGQRLQATGVNARRVVRLTPESIYSEARRLGWSRDETIRVLRLHGYIL